MKIAVLGAGAWGTALALQASRTHQVALWSRSKTHVAEMRKTRMNKQYLGQFEFNDQIQPEHELSAALDGAQMILSVVPTNGFRECLQEIRRIGCQAPLIWANKGLERNTALLPHEIAAEILQGDRATGVLSGPSFAAELVRGLPTAVTVAAQDTEFAKMAAEAFHGGSLRVYTSQDVVGVSVGGALKNVMAIAAGISDGMEFGNNARAALITRGLAEMTRFGMALGGKKDTFMGLTGAGDLLLTCTGQYSRNREVGLQLATGRPLQEILDTLGHVAEGVHTTREVANRARQIGVDMPLTFEIDQVLSNGKSPRDAVMDLFSREQKSETV